jgi:hypothetical protein
MPACQGSEKRAAATGSANSAKSPVNSLLLQGSQAVVVGEHGYMLVDYHRLSLCLQTWEE